jgi:hypothetical protein
MAVEDHAQDLEGLGYGNCSTAPAPEPAGGGHGGRCSRGVPKGVRAPAGGGRPARAAHGRGLGPKPSEGF